MTASGTATNPIVSVCVPVRNEQKYIANTLDTIQKQTHENFEVLIFDNCSTDDTVEICRNYCESDGRFKLFQNQFNVGQIYNFNRCLAPAAGEFVAIRSGNDPMQPDYLKKTLALLRDDPGMGLVYSRNLQIDVNGETLEKQYLDASYFETSSDEPVAAAATVMKRFFHPASFFGVYRKSLLDRLQPLRHIFGSDKIFVCEASLYSSIGCVQEVLSFERRHQRQASLEDIFSEDAVYELPQQSIYASYEGITPIADMIWGFAVMISRAAIDNNAKARLCQISHAVLGNHYSDNLKKEKQRVLGIFANNRELFTNEATNRILNLNRHNYLECVKRIQFTFPLDHQLSTVSRAITGLL